MFNLDQRAAELGSVPKPQFPDTFFPHEKYSGLTRAERRAINRAYKKALGGASRNGVERPKKA